jgi:hypothetical protein
MATPLVRIPQEQGGTLYAFASAARDLTRAYYNPDINFEFSKFALLDIPVVSEPAQGSTNNYIQFDNLFEGGPVAQNQSAPSYDPTVPDDSANRHFAQTFQNYALNLENYILTDDDFDSTVYTSDAEKIFFKYLNHLGAFRVRTATSQEVATGYSRVIEEDDSVLTGSEYSQVVKYLGEIDVTNDKNYGGEVFSEIFINVPSNVGYTPEILFKAADFNTTTSSYQPTGNFINGRDNQTHPDPNINLDPLADNNQGTLNVDETQVYSYGIEWDPAYYAKIDNDPSLNNMLEWSRRGGDFRFNAIAVYYDLYSKSNAGNRATNLYGIIILDQWKYDSGSTGWYIPELSKFKPNEITGLNGNAFALKLNLKFNSSLDNVGVEKNINDYTTFSMDVFFDTTSALENATEILKSANNRYSKIAERLDNLENVILTSSQLQNLNTRMDEIEEDVQNASLNLKSPSSLLELITSVNGRVNDVISGTIPTSVQYNTDVIKQGAGVLLEKSNQKLKLTNTGGVYSMSELFSIDLVSKVISPTEITSATPFNPVTASVNGIWARLKNFENLLRINIDSGDIPSGSNLNIYLDDSVVSFKKGQVVKLSFKTELPNMSGKTIRVWTDKIGGWVMKHEISGAQLLSNKPYIELICIDETNKTLESDIIR